MSSAPDQPRKRGSRPGLRIPAESVPRPNANEDAAEAAEDVVNSTPRQQRPRLKTQPIIALKATGPVAPLPPVPTTNSSAAPITTPAAFDIGAPSLPGAARAMEELAKRQSEKAQTRGEKAVEQERANRLAILISALNATSTKPPEVTPRSSVPELNSDELEDLADAAALATATPPITVAASVPTIPTDDTDVTAVVEKALDDEVIRLPTLSTEPDVITSAPSDPELDQLFGVVAEHIASHKKVTKPPALPEAVLSAPPRLPDELTEAQQEALTIQDDDRINAEPAVEALSADVSFILQCLNPAADGAAILDVGCGNGYHAAQIARRGHSVVGVDWSKQGIEAARQRHTEPSNKLDFSFHDVRHFHLKQLFDHAYCIGSAFGYFDDDVNRSVLGEVNRCLRVGGKLLIEVINRDYVLKDVPARTWREGPGFVVLEEIEFNYFTSRVVTKRSIVHEDGRHIEREFSLRCYSLHELGKLLHHCGFHVHEVSGNIAHRGYFFGVDSRQLILLAEKVTP